MEANSTSKPELLAPVQNWSTLRSIEGLADAVYFGVQNYNMRAKAKNFNRTELSKLVKWCKNRENPIRTYLCTNILIYNSELKDLENLIAEAGNADIDGIIAHDIASITFAKKHKMPFHISTQANISNIESARFYENLGAERIVLARELSLKEIAEIKKELKRTQIETFVHGAMCTSISGRCYFSAAITKNPEASANRGNCVQPCRREWRVIDDEKNEFIYDGLRFLNAKDLCMVEYIPQLIEAGIDAFKIEGRMKDPRYVETATRCYREAIDSYFEGTYTLEKVKVWKKRLSEVYNRGFHTGFYFSRPTVEDIELYERGNISPYQKIYLGTVLSYDGGSKTANITIENDKIKLKEREQIIISGNRSYHVEKIHNIHLKGKKHKVVDISKHETPLKINISVSQPIFPKDKVYILKETKI
ncbi:MAG: U32 family peptidase [Promethearchaeota archaeon]|nr:MAG: U32 family peptidase [Candidatus Lokiarchaeota archaeon]